MSFLRNIRNSISRGNSSTRDSTPNSRRSLSVESNVYRRDSLESKSTGLHRSDTFTLDDDETIMTKVKPSKKEKVLSKFSTFTKRKKSPAPNVPIEEIQKSTYYKWKSGIVSDPDSAQDPFNFLYEQPSSLKSDLSGHSDSEQRKSSSIDCSTYRKNRIPSHLRAQLDQLKNHQEISEEIENDPDKFRTVTINSFRKSFRDKFLSTQNEVPHNPSWFVEVEPADSKADRDKLKDVRSDLFVYENENYRPTSRSPVRKRSPLRNRSPIPNAFRSPGRSLSPPVVHESVIRQKSPEITYQKTPLRSSARSSVRSSVKRTDTFKVEKPTTEPSIRIEIKNSITPNQPGRFVPVGVAKPMPSQAVIQPFRSNRMDSPARGWSSQSSTRPEYFKPGRYQTCIQITSNDPIVNKEPTRIQISGNARSPLRYASGRKADPQLVTKPKQTYFGDNLTRVSNPPSVKARQYIKHSDAYSYSRPTRPTSGFMNRSDANRSSMTQAVPRRSRSPIKAPWR